MKITRGKIPGAMKIVIYGPEGIGKSTFASQFPDPVFIDTEDSTKNMDVRRFDKPSSWAMLKSQVQYVISNPEVCRTLVLDTADWAEQLEISDLLKESQRTGIEDFGYGKGYTYSAERFGALLDLLSEVTKKGIHVVVTAHAQLRKIELPEEMGAYDHWELKTSKKAAPMLREWADAVFFANYKITVVNVDNQGAQKGKNKAQGGRRVMYTAHTPFWDAKNRWGLPDELPFTYDSIRHVIEDSTAPAAPVPMPEPEPLNPEPPMPPAPEPVREAPEPAPEAPAPMPKPPAPPLPAEMQRAAEAAAAPVPPEAVPAPAAAGAPPGNNEPDARIPKNLRDLMIADGITEWDIQNICESKGYVPFGSRIWDYETINPGLVDGGIVGNWESVVRQIREMNKNAEVPFN